MNKKSAFLTGLGILAVFWAKAQNWQPKDTASYENTVTLNIRCICTPGADSVYKWELANTDFYGQIDTINKYLGENFWLTKVGPDFVKLHDLRQEYITLYNGLDGKSGLDRSMDAMKLLVLWPEIEKLDKSVKNITECYFLNALEKRDDRK